MHSELTGWYQKIKVIRLGLLNNFNFLVELIGATLRAVEPEQVKIYPKNAVFLVNPLYDLYGEVRGNTRFLRCPL